MRWNNIHLTAIENEHSSLYFAWYSFLEMNVMCVNNIKSDNRKIGDL